MQVFTAQGQFLRQWGTSGEGEGQFDEPQGIAVDREGNVYVTGGNDRVQVFTAQGQFLGQWGHHGKGEGEFDLPVGIAVDSEGNVYVVDRSNDRVQVFSVKFEQG